MRLRFACRACEATVATAAITPPADVACPDCGSRTFFAAPPGNPDAPIDRCLTCGGPHLFLQKEFPRRLGLGIAILGAGLFLVLMGLERIYLGFAVLLGVALVDALVYRAAKMLTVCYHCRTEYRRHPVNPRHEGYDPKIAFYTAKKGIPARPGLSRPSIEAPGGASGPASRATLLDGGVEGRNAGVRRS